MTDIAMSVGYSSLSAFNVAFPDFAGQTPTEIRTGFTSANNAGIRD